LQSSGFSPRFRYRPSRFAASCGFTGVGGATVGALSLIDPSGLKSCGAARAVTDTRAHRVVSSSAGCGGVGSSTFGASTRTLVVRGVNGAARAPAASAIAAAVRSTRLDRARRGGRTSARLLAHAEPETDELDHGQRDREEKPEQHQPAIPAAWSTAAALPRLSIAHETQAAGLMQARSGAPAGYVAWAAGGLRCGITKDAAPRTRQSIVIDGEPALKHG